MNFSAVFFQVCVSTYEIYEEIVIICPSPHTPPEFKESRVSIMVNPVVVEEVVVIVHTLLVLVSIWQL